MTSINFKYRLDDENPKNIWTRFLNTKGQYQYINPKGVALGDKDNIYSILAKRIARNPDEDMVSEINSEGHFEPVIAKDYLNRVRSVAKGMLAIGIKKGTPISIISHTSLDWAITDVAALSIGAVVVPIYETSSTKQISYIFQDSDIEYVFCENSDLVDKCKRTNLLQTDRILNYQKDILNQLISRGEKISDYDLDKKIDLVKSSDLASTVYTSGSTGNPKGVDLKHEAFVSVSYNASLALPELLNDPNAKMVLFLPLAHVFARFLSFAFYAAPNAKIAFSHGIKNLLAELDEYQPSVLLGVPRVFEKVYNASSQKASKGAAKLVFKNAAKAAVAYSKALETPEGPSMKQKAARNAFVIPVYSKIRAALGGNIKYCVCGAAPLNTEINHFFRGAGITILEGYGLTETVAPVFVNRPTFNKVGTIGVPFPDVKLRISDDDELLLKSPSNMSGYHNLPSENKSALHNGWFHTGDLASVDEDGFVKIIGRKKDIIITAGGKNVTPSVLEKCIDENIIVQASLVVGDGRPFISALVALDVDELKGWAKKQDILQQITDQNGKILLEIAKDHPIIRAEIDRSVTEANKLVSQAESIRKYEILPEDFSEQNETYTPSMKVRRPQVIERYADIIKNEIYGKPRGK